MKTDPPTDAPGGLRDAACCALRIPSKERGCIHKTKFGKNYQKEADKLSKKWGKRYGAYRCPHCGSVHLTKKIRKRGEYHSEMLYITPKSILHNVKHIRR